MPIDGHPLKKRNSENTASTTENELDKQNSISAIQERAEERLTAQQDPQQQQTLHNNSDLSFFERITSSKPIENRDREGFPGTNTSETATEPSSAVDASINSALEPATRTSVATHNNSDLVAFETIAANQRRSENKQNKNYMEHEHKHEQQQQQTHLSVEDFLQEHRQHIAGELEKLSNLYKEGVLTENEFNTAKQRVTGAQLAEEKGLEQGTTASRSFTASADGSDDAGSCNDDARINKNGVVRRHRQSVAESSQRQRTSSRNSDVLTAGDQRQEERPRAAGTPLYRTTSDNLQKTLSFDRANQNQHQQQRNDPSVSSTGAAPTSDGIPTTTTTTSTAYPGGVPTVTTNVQSWQGDQVLAQHRHKAFLGKMKQGAIQLPCLNIGYCCRTDPDRPLNDHSENYVVATIKDQADKELGSGGEGEVDVSPTRNDDMKEESISINERRTPAARRPPSTGPFYWCVRVVPKDWVSAWVLSIVGLFPVIVFCVSVLPPSCSFADEHYKRPYASHLMYWPRALAIAFWLVFEIILCLASRLDPGIVPPASATGKFRPPSETRRLVHKPTNTPIEQEVCRTCRVDRPIRSGHCYTCDTCVRGFDHHCGVLGSCVGERTFRFFTLFMYVTFAFALYLVGFSIFMMAYFYRWDVMRHSNGDRWRLVAALGTTVYAAIGGCTVIGPMGFYTQLACTGKTQKDLYGRRSQSGKIAESEALKNGCSECLRRLFGPMPPSQIVAYL